MGAALLEGAFTTSTRASAEAGPPTPARYLSARRMRPRSGAVAPGTRLGAGDLFGTRVFANGQDGFALANDGSAQYPALTADGGRVWRIDGPQLHIDAADGAQGVGYVGAGDPRTYLAYGSSVVDVTTDAGQEWWETFLGELVIAVVPGSGRDLVAFVQQSRSNNQANSAATWQYVSSDGGRHWRYATALGGGY